MSRRRRFAGAVGLSLAIMVGFGCSGPAPQHVASAGARASVGTKVNADASAYPGWSYDVTAAPNGASLSVEATFPRGTATTFIIGDDAGAYVHDAVVVEGARRTPLASGSGPWELPTCASGCVVSYRFDLAAAARASRDPSVAQMHGASIQAPPSTWLLRPADAKLGTAFRFHVTSAPGEAFACGVFPVPGAPDTYEGHTDEGSFELPYAAFGKMDRKPFADGHVEVAFFDGALERPLVYAWIEQSARAVEAFYGRFPIPRVLVLLRASPGKRVGFGTTMGSSGAAIQLSLGDDVGAEALHDDWMLVHEMIHTALPNVTRDHHWLEEGIATYAEPLARAGAGLVTPEVLWRDWILGMPKGEPAAGDEGLDRTHTWGRTYWGGALFCLEADVTIRERTGGKRSLVDALRAIVAHGGNISVTWPLEKVLDTGDAATGLHVLRETYARMSRQPAPVDLPALWSKLGVRLESGKTVFDDAAPLASIRRAMTEPLK